MTAATVRSGLQAPISPATWRLAWVIVFGAFTTGLDSSLTAIGLRTIGRDLHAGLATVQWITSGYLLALAVALPLCGWLGRRVGVGRLWLAALGGFVVLSGACAAAPTMTTLIAARVAQGISAGLLLPTGQAILGRSVGPERLGRVMSVLGIVVTAAPALGPVVGGLLLDVASWRWLFLINLPIGALGLVLGMRFVPRGDSGTAPALDLPGFACIGSGLPLLVYALTLWGSAGAATGRVLLLGGSGALCLVGFGVRSRRTAHPLFDLGLLRNRVFLAAVVAAGCGGAVMAGTAVLLPLYFQVLHGAGTVATGVSLLAFGAGTIAGLPVAGRLTDRYGGGVVAIAGSTVAAGVFGVFALAGARADPLLVQVLLAAAGAAIAFVAVPPGVAAYKTVDVASLPDATTQVNILQRVGGALGAALFTVVLAANLPAGADHAFAVTFGCVCLGCLVSVAASGWLAGALRRAG